MRSNLWMSQKMLILLFVWPRHRGAGFWELAIGIETPQVSKWNSNESRGLDTLHTAVEVRWPFVYLRYEPRLESLSSELQDLRKNPTYFLKTQNPDRRQMSNQYSQLRVIRKQENGQPPRFLRNFLYFRVSPPQFLRRLADRQDRKALVSRNRSQNPSVSLKNH